MSQAQEVRTIFTWDTSDVDKGVKRMEQAMERVKKSNEDTGKKLKDGHGNDSNFGMGLRDLAEGRGVNALQRFGHALGATALRLSAYMMAAKLAGEAIGHLNEQMEKVDSNSRQLETSFVGNNRRSTFATAGMGSGELAGLRVQNLEALKAENEHQGETENVIEAQKPSWYNVPGVLMSAGTSVFRDLQGKRTPEQERAASEARAKVYAGEQSRLHGLYSASLESQAHQAQYNAPGDYNAPYQAKARELDLQRELEISNAKAADASKEDLLNIERRYEYLQKTVTAESHLGGARFENARKLLEIEGGNGSKFGRGLASTNERMRQSRDLLNSGNLTVEQRNAEELNLQREGNAQREQLMGRYLNPDGTARNPAAIQRDFLKDSAEARARGRFLRRFEAGGYDPVTGRRRATGDRPGSGLHSSGLTTGHLQGASMATMDHPFPHYRSPVPVHPAALDIASIRHFTEMVPPRAHMTNQVNPLAHSGEVLEKIFSALDQRLPKASAN